MTIPITPLICVLTTLNINIGYTHGISTSTVCRVVRKTTKLICLHVSQFIKFRDDMATCQTEYFNVAGK